MIELPKDLGEQVAAALREDIGSGDVTARLVPGTQVARGRVITREDAVLCGQSWVDETFRRLDASIRVDWNADDGDRVRANQIVFEIQGPARAMLTGERTAYFWAVRRPGSVLRVSRMVQPVPATASTKSRVCDAVPESSCRKLSAVRSPVSTARAGP